MKKSKFCSECGSENKESQEFCNYCGKPITKKENNENWFSKQSTDVKIIVGIAGICCISVIILVIIAMIMSSTIQTDFNKDSNTNNSTDEYLNQENNYSSDQDNSSSSDMDIGYYSADSALSQFDSNGDNKISWSEWVAWCEYDENNYGITYTNYASSDFNNYDSNGDGYLDRTELARYLVGSHEYYV